jgi:tetratricopeptide (TPR) repeat protein
MIEALLPQALSDAAVWHSAGLVARDLGQPAKASEAVDRALALAPGNAGLLHLKARILLDRGLPAVAAFDRAVAAAPADPTARRGRAAALLAADGPAAAEAELVSAAAALADDPGIHADLASLRLQMGAGEAFDAGFTAASARRPSSLDLWRVWVAVTADSPFRARVPELIARARAAVGDQPGFALAEAAARSDAGEHGAAEALLSSAALATDPDAVVIAVRHLIRTGRLTGAAAAAEAGLNGRHAFALWPYLSTLWRLLGDPRADWLDEEPSLVRVWDLAPLLPDLPAIADHLRGLHRMKSAPPDQSVRGGTQTDGHLLLRDDPPIRRLRTAIEQVVAAHIAQLGPEDIRHPTLAAPRGPFRFSGSWSVRLRDCGFHVPHTHSQGWISSALYLALPNAPARQGWLKLGEPPADLGLDLPPSRWIEPAPGRLVLFPSTMWHGTEPFDAGERLTVAFDVLPLI